MWLQLSSDPRARNSVQLQGGALNKRRTRMRGALLIAGAIGLSFAVTTRADDGPATFKGQCAACHGADGSGSTAVGKSLKIRDLRSADVQKQTDEQLTGIITNGKGAMPAYKDKMTADQIQQLVAFIRQLAKKG